MFRKQLAVADSLLCRLIPSRARYQGAWLNEDRELLPVATAAFHHLANAEWWANVWAPQLLNTASGRQWTAEMEAMQNLRAGSFVVQSLP
jgi:hypothetical protein